MTLPLARFNGLIREDFHEIGGVIFIWGMLGAIFTAAVIGGLYCGWVGLDWIIYGKS